jgi:hypothetical protein
MSKTSAFLAGVYVGLAPLPLAVVLSRISQRLADRKRRAT